VTTALRTTDPLVDLDDLVRDLAEVCRSPLAVNEPEVGDATLAVSQATAELARATFTSYGLRRTRVQVQETMVAARQAIERARAATERSRLERMRAERARVPAAAGRTGEAAPRAAAFLLRSWTTARDVRVTCDACARPFHVRYRYRFMEGLAPHRLPCPWPECTGAREFHLPVNSLEICVQL